MKIRFFSYAQPEPRKNRPLISFISHDLASAYTFPTPHSPRLHCLATDRRSKRHDA
jgi:hypothetical protein